MDPELIKAIREMMEKLPALQAGGVVVTPEQQDEFIRVRTGGKYGMDDAQRVLGDVDNNLSLRNLTRSAVQGAAFNFGDEILGAVGGEGAKEMMRLREDLFKRAHPYADAAAGVAGGLVVPGLGVAGGVAKGASVARAIGAGSIIGGAVGAASGAGAGEGFKDRAERAVGGGILGAAAGSVIPAVTGSAKLIASPVARAERRLQRAINQSGGTDALQRRAAEFARGGRGNEVMLGDLSPQMRSQLDFAANNSEDVFDTLGPQLAQRQAGMPQRLLNDVQDLVDVPDNAQAQIRQLRQQRKDFADPAYEALRRENADLPVTPELAAQIEKPVVQGALSRAKENGLIGEPPDRANLSFGHMLDVRRSVKSAKDRAFRAGDGTLGKALAETRDAIEAEMERMVPAWRAVNDQYRRFSGLIDRVVEGHKAWTQEDSRELTSLVQRLRHEAPEELKALRTGLASRLVSRLRSTKTNRDEAKSIVDAGIAMQEKLEAVFGNRKTFDEFMRRARLEADMSKSRGALGNSATHRRGAAAGVDPLEVGVSAATGGITGAMAQIPSFLGRMGRSMVGRETANRLAPALRTQGAGEITALLRRFKQRTPTVGPFAAQVLPFGIGTLFDNQ